MENISSFHAIAREKPDSYYEKVLTKLSFFCTAISLLICILGIIGYFSGYLILARISTSFIPMAPLTVLSFLIINSALLIHLSEQSPSKVKSFFRISVTIIYIICFIVLIDYFLGTKIDLERVFKASPEKFGNVPTQRMSPVTAVNFIFLGISLLLIFPFLKSKKNQRVKTASLLSSVVCFSSFVLLIGYLFNQPILYGSNIIPVALNTAIAFLFLSLGVIFSAGHYHWPVNLFTGISVRAMLMRTFLPVFIFYIILDNYIDNDIYTNLPAKPLFILTLLTIFFMMIFSSIISRLSKTIGCRIEEVESSLIKSESLFRSVIHTVPAVVICLSPEGEILEFNPEAEKLYGKKLEDVIGKNFYKLFIPEKFRDSFIKNSKKVLNGEKVTGIEDHFDLKNGSKRMLMWNNDRIIDDNKNVLGIIAVGHDITELKKQEEELSKSREMFKGIYEQSPIGIEIYDSQGTLIDINLTCMEILGIKDIKDVIGFKLFNDPNLTDEIKGKLLRSEPAREEIVYDFDLVRKNKLYETTKSGKSYLNIFITPWEIKKYGQKGYIVRLNDITREKYAEKELKVSQERFKNIVESTGEWVWEVDANGLYTYSNPVVEKMLGYTPEEVVGRKHFYDLFDPEMKEKLKKIAFENFSKKLPLKNLVNPFLHKNGSKVFLETNGVPVLDKEDNLMGYRGMDSDITEKRSLQGQFLQSQKMEAIGKLAGGVAHDFNNILTAIMGYSEMVETKISGNDKVKNYIKEIKNGIERASSLTNQLLAFSRKQNINPKTININSLVINLKKMLLRLIGEDIEMVTVLEKNLNYVKADPGQIEQVIMNLVVNARDAMPSGGKLIIKTENTTIDENYARILSCARPGKFVILSIEDAGSGMDKETIKHIFEPFFTTKGLGKGTGLGLS
ncbi:MAG: hypothetical protein A2W05_00165, partial [Candidatus Schekmanbacteria bacterium RBG_16_38_10]